MQNVSIGTLIVMSSSTRTVPSSPHATQIVALEFDDIMCSAPPRFFEPRRRHLRDGHLPAGGFVGVPAIGRVSTTPSLDCAPGSLVPILNDRRAPPLCQICKRRGCGVHVRFRAGRYPGLAIESTFQGTREVGMVDVARSGC